MTAIFFNLSKPKLTDSVNSGTLATLDQYVTSSVAILCYLREGSNWQNTTDCSILYFCHAANLLIPATSSHMEHLLCAV